MSDIIRAFRSCGSEQEQRQIQRSINRLVRAVGTSSPVSAPSYFPPPRPVFPGGIVPVLLINPPRSNFR